LRQLGDKWGIANSLSSLGDLAIDQGDYTSANGFLIESLSLNQELGDRTGTAYALEYFSGLATVYGRPERALCLAGAAATLREAIGAPLPSADQVALERRLESARKALSDAEQAAAWGQGCAMTMEQAIDYALARA
jgi:hypothetical protein